MKRLVLSTISLLIVLLVNAGAVSENQALEKARQFMPGKVFYASTNKAGSGNASTSSPYYIFNVENNAGFVIVSGDDRTKAILGFSDEGTINLSNLPENVAWWLNYYDEAISSLGHSSIEECETATSSVRNTINPLIKTTWNQGSPYNDNCKFDGTECLTGCVATAMAQIVNYYQYPSEVAAIDGYTTSSYSYTVPALSVETMDWENMCTTYGYNDNRTSNQKTAVATLMRYCGQSVEMNYGPNSSGASSEAVSVALLKYFDYNKSVHAIYRDGYSPEGWENEIYQELAGGYPVLYSGSTTTGAGHAFICDGYQDGLFHVNWGWGGYCDGYFVLTIMDSHGKNEIDWTFSENQSAVVGIRPTNGGTLNYPLITVSSLKVSYREVTRGSASENFEVSVSYKFDNSVNSEDDLAGAGIALYKGNEMVKSLMQWSASSQKPGWYYYGSRTFNFGSDLTDGTYRIEAVYKDKDGNIHQAQGFGYNYIEAVVKGKNLTLTNYPLLGNVSLNKSELAIKKEATEKLKATVSPSSLEDKTVTWKSSDKNIATVSKWGTVTGVNYGTTTITCTSKATGASATCTVTVGNISLNKSKTYIKKNKTEVLKVTLTPSTLSDKSVTWKSSNKSIATVSSSGTVKGVKYGTATITCTSKATGLSATCKVTVGNVSLNKSELAIKKGATEKLKATIYPSSLDDKTVTWKSSNTNIATVSKWGTVTGVGHGTATITCTSKATGLSTTCKVTVEIVEGVGLNKSELSLTKGSTEKLKATVYPSTLDDKTVTWKSSNKNVATVSKWGTVKGINNGTATITCTSKATGLSATCLVTVTASAGTRSLEEDDDGEVTEIEEINEGLAIIEPFDVYDLSGRMVLHHVTSLDGLPKGIYIVNGRKVIKK